MTRRSAIELLAAMLPVVRSQITVSNGRPRILLDLGNIETIEVRYEIETLKIDPLELFRALKERK